MPPPIVLYPGNYSVTGNQKIARITWHEAVKGTAVVKDGTGAIVANLPFTSGNEPSVSFNPPVTADGGVHAFALGGWLQIYLQGSSSFGG